MFYFVYKGIYICQKKKIVLFFYKKIYNFVVNLVEIFYMLYYKKIYLYC